MIFDVVVRIPEVDIMSLSLKLFVHVRAHMSNVEREVRDGTKWSREIP
jgi:hypothetical protein